MWRATPLAWRQTMPPLHGAPEGHTLPPPPLPQHTHEAVEKILAAIGWELPKEQQRPNKKNLLVASTAFTVKTATQLQTQAMGLTRQAKHRQFIQAALADAGQPLPAKHRQFIQAALADAGQALPPAAVVDARMGQLEKLFQDMWKLPWENSNKEIWWRLAVRGVSAAGGHDICISGPCPCGWQLSTGGEEGAQRMQQHTFWDCPVAQAVMQQVRNAIPAAPEVSRKHLWLLQAPPDSGLYQPVWAVVCLAALNAMQQGRAYMWALHKRRQELLASYRASGGRQVSLEECWQRAAGTRLSMVPPGGSPTSKASARAAALFWSHLQDFADIGIVPVDWVQRMSPSHAFMRIQPKPRSGHCLVLHLPVDIVLPEDLY
eukprot:CAMPEP_0202920642 /NCGR_PEP_ID=MMETSP1392-20130828/76966_1 /ASSEMBLY_ACC=CAM_ASM_000868 /TAXON_ID=225041 /ORGANISM="Chlamydomonas chlamydogama, Strain SAG 11-48b" /LENGTH=374 /DNA_ID=CAMNT_0049614149 /DNA_START=11 /DNA_END=1135 /DNA_ORIENTATION=-